MLREMKANLVLPHLDWKEKIAIFVFLVGIGISVSGLLLLWNQTNTPIQANTQIQLEKNDNEKPRITVDVGGAVNNPGIHTLEEGARISHAIAVAGGFSDTADTYFITHTLNLAIVLNDSEKIYVPFVSERKGVDAQSSTTSEVADANGISINNGSLEELDTLAGIGEKRAEDIIANRPYSTLEELVSKKVITQTMFDSLKKEIKL